MTTYEIELRQTATVTVDESKFTPEFMQEFRANFYPFNTIKDHVEHLAQLYASGVVDNSSFIEGYGMPSEMGIKVIVD